ncbi:MAG TPA: ABC transporter permease subunit [Candidatus Nanoarchaeia archaeon]|nr:hypothetical protein [uncultured archaeon]
MGNIVLHQLKTQRKSLFFWSLGIVVLVALYILIYPSIQESSAALNAYLENLPDAIKAFVGDVSSYTTPVGYITSELFVFMMPLLLIIFTTGFGSGAIAGEEEKGTLDLLLTNPIERSQVVKEKFIAMIILASLLTAVASLALIIGSALADMGLETQKIVAMVLSVDLLAIAFGSIALFLGALTGNRGVSLGITAALAIGSFFLNALSPLVDFLKDYQKFSPFYHYIGENPLEVGLKIDHVLILGGIAFVFLILSLIAFEKRDLKI